MGYRPQDPAVPVVDVEGLVDECVIQSMSASFISNRVVAVDSVESLQQAPIKISDRWALTAEDARNIESNGARAHRETHCFTHAYVFLEDVADLRIKLTVEDNQIRPICAACSPASEGAPIANIIAHLGAATCAF
jgi:hypothetical protein